MKKTLIIVSIIVVVLVIAWLVWINWDEIFITEDVGQSEIIGPPVGQIDYSNVKDLNDCPELECGLQMLDNNKITLADFKKYLQDYEEKTGEFADCYWDWDLFEERIQDLKEGRKTISESGAKWTAGITCYSLMPDEYKPQYGSTD